MTEERTARLTAVLEKRQPGLTLILENVFDPHNIAAVMRTADAVGVQDLYILNTKIPSHDKWSAKTSSSAAKWLSVHQFDNTAACYEAVRKQVKKIYTTHLAKDAVDLYNMNLAEDVALVFGNEHSGVSEEAISLADGNFIIPQVGIIQSLNISVACAVTLYEAYRQRKQAGKYDSTQLQGAALEQLKTDWGMNK